MFKGVPSMQMSIFVLVFTTTFKYSSTSCQIIDNGALIEEQYIDEDCQREYLRYRNYLPEGKCLTTRQVYAGPTTFRCINSSLQEIFVTNLGRDTNNYFYVSESSLSSLTIETRTWSRMKELTFENTNISKIIPGFFNGFTELTLLSISHNNVTVLTDYVFASLINLVHLNLSFNSIYSIESFSFVRLSKLTILDLHNNKIKSLPSKLFGDLSKLTYLDLSDNLLNTPVVTDISSLEKLLLGNNNLSVFGFPNNTDSSHFKILDISKNNIIKIENFEMCNATEINVSFNNIKTLRTVGEITKCNIAHNGITFVGKHFVANSVSTLDLSFNSVYNISSEAFDKGVYLTHLYLNDNNLKELSIGTFKNQEHLEHLDLSNNRILYFEFGLFNNLKNLKYLNISYNKGVLDFQALFRVNQLQTLDFEQNQPDNFDKFFFETHEKLEKIRMGYDGWDCGDLAKIIHLMEKRNITVLKGNNVNSAHIHGIDCKTNLQYISKNNSDTTTMVYEDKENRPQNDFILLNNSIIPDFDDFKDQFLGIFNKSLENIEKNNIQANLNFFFCNAFLLLIFCSLLAFIWCLKKRKIVQGKEQVELL